jgi:hypothetical protein
MNCTVSFEFGVVDAGDADDAWLAPLVHFALALALAGSCFGLHLVRHDMVPWMSQTIPSMLERCNTRGLSDLSVALMLVGGVLALLAVCAGVFFVVGVMSLLWAVSILHSGGATTSPGVDGQTGAAPEAVDGDPCVRGSPACVCPGDALELGLEEAAFGAVGWLLLCVVILSCLQRRHSDDGHTSREEATADIGRDSTAETATLAGSSMKQTSDSSYP